MCVNSACMNTNTTRHSINFPLNKPSPSLTLIWTHLQLLSHMEWNIYQRERLLVEMTETCDSSDRELQTYTEFVSRLIFFESHTMRPDWGERSQSSTSRVRRPSFTLMCDDTKATCWHSTQSHWLHGDTEEESWSLCCISLWSSQMSEQDWCIVQHSVYCRLMGAEDVWSALILLLYLLVSVASVLVSTGVFS